VNELLVAEAVREAVLGVAGVLGVSPGVGYIEATYGRGIHVRGVGIAAENGRVAANVHLVVGATPLPALARRIRRVVRMTIEREVGVPSGPINLFFDHMILSAVVPGVPPA
jgi:uncharacterized alkaline shock family protein YloU